VLPRGPILTGPALITPFDLPAWLGHQREQELAGTPPHAHTHPLHVQQGGYWLGASGGAKRQAKRAGGEDAGAGGSEAPPHAAMPLPCYTHSLQVRFEWGRVSGMMSVCFTTLTGALRLRLLSLPTHTRR